MSDRAARLIALSLIVCAGGILLGSGTIAVAINSNRQDAQTLGLIVLLGGGILFLVEYLGSRSRPE